MGNGENKAKVTPEIAIFMQLDEMIQGIKRVENSLNSDLPEGIVETYEVNATTQPQTLWPPVKNGIRSKWLSVNVINDSPSDTSIQFAVNVGSANSFTVKAGESNKVSFGDKCKIEYISYKVSSGTVPIRIECTR